MIQVHAWSWFHFQVTQDRLEKERKVYFPPKRESEKERLQKGMQSSFQLGNAERPAVCLQFGRTVLHSTTRDRSRGG